MTFIQVVEFRTSRMDEIQALAQERVGSDERSTVRRSIVTQDRDDPGVYRVLAFFDSYESAMENSQLPGTQEFAEQAAKLTDAPPKFLNLDVIEETDRG